MRLGVNMDYLERIKLLFREPAYRLRLFVFFLLGGLLFFAALGVPEDFWRDTLVQFAVVFIGVGFVGFVWDVLGGDPIDSKLDSLHRYMAVLSDIADGNIGIERIWPNRGVWERALVDGLAAWKERVGGAASVDIVSNTLYTRWFHDDAFVRKFFENIAHGKKARILIYDPRANAVHQRAFHEQGRRGEMQSEIESTLVNIAQYRETLDDAGKRNLQVRLTTTYYHLAQIIRADDKILIAIYLSGKSGTPSPTFQLRGPDTEYFRTYQEQIEILWRHGREVDDDEFRQILAQGQIQLGE